MPDVYLARFTQAFVVTPNVGPIKGTPNGSNGKPIPYISGFMADVAGTVTGIAQQGPGTPVVLTILGGVLYPIALKEVHSVTTISTLTGFL